MITSDWHIHSRNSCDAACMRMEDLIRGAAEKGIREYGVTDHIHTPFNFPDLSASRREFEGCRPPPAFHFGVEASVVSRWEIDEIVSGRYQGPPPVYGLRSGGPPSAPLAIAVTERDIAAHHVEYVVGGAHWGMYVPLEREAIIRDYHRQNMFLATHPLVDMVAHPWWWHGHWRDADGRYTTDPWLDTFAKIPASMHDEFASAAIERGVGAEINIGAMLLTRKYSERFKRQYLEYLAYLQGRGVVLGIGSDCHSAQYDVDFGTAAGMLESVGISGDGLWRLTCGE